MLAIALTPQLRRLELGDDAAITQGARVNRERAVLLVVGVTTTALVTVCLGGLYFIWILMRESKRQNGR